jgi:hypothetical protein
MSVNPPAALLDTAFRPERMFRITPRKVRVFRTHVVY